MNSLIYIEVLNQISFTYEKEFISKVKKSIPEIETLDLDNYSEADLINYAIELIKRSEKCALVFKSEADASLGKIMILLEELLQNKEKSAAILIGENKIIEKMLKQTENFSLNPKEELGENMILNFLKSGSNSR